MVMISSYAQEYEYGEVDKEELLQKSYKSDTTANAVILLNKKKVHFTTIGGKLFAITEVHKRIKFYNKLNFDYATENIFLYKNRHVKEKITILEGFTYTFSNGKILKTPLDRDGIFKENFSDNYEIAKFTMPNVKEGSVIEFKYKLLSPFVFDIDKVHLQYDIPIKKTDIHLRIPKFISFRKFSTGFIPVNLKEFTHKDPDFYVNVNHYIATNTPAFEKEPYSGNSDNYISSVIYEVSVINYPNGPILRFSNTWEDVVKTVYKSPDFGPELKKAAYFKRDLDSVLKGITNLENKMYAVYRFLQKKMTWNNKKSLFVKGGVKKAYKEGLGNSAEINLILTAMLTYAGIDSNPIMVSTSDKTLTAFPTVDGFNYLISRAKISNSIFYLDATDKYGVPNILPSRVLKGIGRVIAENRTSQMINYRPVKPSVTKINLQYDINGHGKITGKCSIRYFDFFANRFRKKNSQKSSKELMKRLEQEYEINNLKEYVLQQSKDLTKEVKEQFSFDIDNNAEVIGDEMFFSPLLFLVEKENVFKSNERNHPIDFGFGFSYSYLLNVKIPKGFEAVELPNNVSFKLPQNLGVYSFKIVANQDMVQILVKKTINNSIITPEYYTYLKEFYNQIIQKEQQQIVLRRIN